MSSSRPEVGICRKLDAAPDCAWMYRIRQRLATMYRHGQEEQDFRRRQDAFHGHCAHRPEIWHFRPLSRRATQRLCRTSHGDHIFSRT